MKTLYKFLGIAILLLMVSCYDGIDSINPVDPGPDEAPPTIQVNYPTDGTQIQVREDVTAITVDVEVEDDIEIALVEIEIDGEVIGQYSEFKDYRKAVIDDLVYDNVTNGSHTLTITAVDINDKTTSQTADFEKKEAYNPIYDGEIFYMPFNGDYSELVSITKAGQVGSPGITQEAAVGTGAYKGATDAYLTFSTEGLLGDEISATFWFKVNADPDRAGILVMGPEDTDNPDAQNLRTSGFRLFREAAGDMQRFKLNVGTGEGESWFDGGEAADVDPATTEWVHLAFTIAADQATVYINGEIVSQSTFAGVDWTGCDVLSIMSGAPRFAGWGHLSDLSQMDELRLYNKALTQEEVSQIMNNDL